MRSNSNNSIKLHKKAVRLGLHFLVHVFSIVFNIYSQTPRQRRILTRNYNRKSNFHHIFTFVALSFAFMLLAIDTNAQSSYTPTALKHGTSAGSTALSEFESINPYSGNLNFSLPLIEVGGRGSTNIPIKLNINQRWMFKKWYDELNQNQEYPYMDPNTWNINYRGKDTIDSPVKVTGVQTGSGVNTNCAGQPSGVYNYTNTILTFTAPDGTEYPMRDRNTNGQPYQVNCNLNGYSRGTIFDSIDGSTATFISDSAIHDEPYADYHEQIYWLYPTGNLITKDGTLYRIEGGGFKWSRDKNGNKITLTYLNQGSNFKLTDSLNREVIVEYDVQDIAPYGLCNKITYKGFGGADRIIRISYDDMLSHLRAGYSPQTGQQLFPVNFASSYPQYRGGWDGSTNYTTSKVSAVWLPDGRSYKLQYNSYGELARVEMPTGGAIEYDWGFNTGSGQLGIIYGSNTSVTGSTESYYRRVTKRRVYSNGTTLDNELVLSGLEPLGNKTGYVVEDQYDNSSNLVNRVKHYYYGIVGSNDPQSISGLLIFQDPWRNGREYQTDVYNSNGTTLLRKTTNNWQQSSPSWWTQSSDYAPTTNPHITETTTTLADSNQVSKQTFTYDSFNNLTDTYEYDYGSGTPGQFLRRSHADYLTTNPVNNVNYTTDSIHILGLASQSWTSSDISGNNKVSLTQFEYDNYAADQNHAGLVDRTSISGHDSTFGASCTNRGNVTKVKSFADAQNQTGSVSVYTQYDIAGNSVKTTDARGNSTTIDYSDKFGLPNAEARNNSAPSLLNGQNTFAFATSATNPLGWTTYAQFDYQTGLIVDNEDITGNINTVTYNDVLDRPTQAITANNVSNLRSQTTIVYDDTNRKVTATSDLFSFGDNLAKTESFYDKMGRTVESRKYETGGYTAVNTVYDKLGRAYKGTNPYRPFLNETQLWTTSEYDALGRVIKVKTPDNAEVTKSYLGDTTTVTDQAGKKRKGISDALGRMTQVIEDPDGQNLVTDYVFDTLGNLRKTIQGGQSRYFTYNSLGRLLYAKQPEQDTNTAFVATDSITGNTQWSVKYLYDNNGNITSTTDARGVTVTGTYDNLNRLTFRDYSDTTPDVTFTYDDSTIAYSKGKMTKVSSSVSETKYTSFDNVGRLLAQQQITDGQTYNTAYSYNLAGALVEETYPSGRVVKNTFNQDGNLSQVQSRRASTGFHTYAGSFTYNSAGATEKMQLGNGRWETAAFNNRLQLTQIGLGVTDADQNLLKLEYNYGIAAQNNGSLKEQKITAPTVGTNQGFTATQTYAYDNLNRIQSATETISSSQTWKQTFQYDRYGNKSFDAANTTTLGSCSQMVCNPTISTSNNRFSTGQGYSYDLTGNVTQDAGGKQFFYDAENRQKEVKDANNNTIGLYLYDGEGKRVKKISNTETVIFVYNGGGQLIAEYSTQISQTQQVSYLTADNLGSPRIITDQNGIVTSRKDYAPFGDETFTAQRTQGLGYQPDTIRQDYTGYQKDDESGLDYAQARYYNSSHGRFTSVDPLTASISIKNPQTFNRYSYGLNSPYKFTDSLGLRPCEAGASHEMTFSNPCDNSADLSNGAVGQALADYNERLKSTLASAAANRAIARGDQPAALEDDPQSMGTIIMAYGQSGTGEINVGENFARAARTAQENAEAQGYNVINVGEIGSLNGFQNLLDTAAKNDAIRIYLFTHGATNALDIGNGVRSDTKDVTMVSVKKLYNSSKSLESIFIHGCNVGASDNGIGQALSNQLGVRVRATTTGQDFSARPDRQTNPNGQKHPSTGPTYMIPVGRGIWRNFYPSR